MPYPFARSRTGIRNNNRKKILNNNSRRKEWRTKYAHTLSYSHTKCRKKFARKEKRLKCGAAFHVMHMHDWRLLYTHTHTPSSNGFSVWHVHDRISSKYRQDNGNATYLSISVSILHLFQAFSFGFVCVVFRCCCLVFLPCRFSTQRILNKAEKCNDKPL